MLDSIEEMMDSTMIHLGKKSAGSKFVINLNEETYYKNDVEFEIFVQNGTIYDENGRMVEHDAFFQLVKKSWDPITGKKLTLTVDLTTGSVMHGNCQFINYSFV